MNYFSKTNLSMRERLFANFGDMLFQKGKMAESLKPEWRVLTTENGGLLYHNDKTGEETLESPYLAQLNKYKNCDLAIWWGNKRTLNHS